MASVSKRQQARNERELQDLIRTIPGNSQCADCQARNPGWASWSLGIFLCMRCASIHRKLGTHISKVKSLSMDTWSADQVENMKQNGNIAANKAFNPKNRKPDIPLDADEVDSAMERFIRKKYQEKSLADGKPLLPSRSETHTAGREAGAGLSVSPENSPPPPPPPKKGKFFGFGLRASSSTYPNPKNNKKSLPREPRVDNAFRISSDSHETAPKRGSQRQMSEEEIEEKLLILNNMGFTDSRRNRTVLMGLDGNMERTVESLVRIQQTSKSEAGNPSSTGRSTNTPTTSVAFPPPSADFVPQPSGSSSNPFDQSSNQQDFGLSFDAPPPQQQQTTNFAPGPDRRVAASTNPFDIQPQTQPNQGLDQAFQNMQLSRQLFPHSTGGYPSQLPPMQDPRFQHSMTPPVPQRYGYMASPAQPNVGTNPFFQSPQSSPVVANNPYASLMQNQPYPVPSANPYLSQMAPISQEVSQQPQQQPMRSSSGFNPFGIPPSQPGSPPPGAPSQQQSIYDPGPPAPAAAQSISFQPFPPQQSNPQQNPLLQQGQTRFQNFQYGQSQFQQQQPQYQPSQQFQQSQPQFQQPQPQFQQPQAQFQAPPQSVYGQPPQQPILPQQTGRIDKSSILALYNYPQLAPQPLASIPEPTEVQQPISQAPTDLFSALTTSHPKRSVTMPVGALSMHSAGGGGSRNPFLNMSNNSSASSTPMPGYGPGIGARHASAESVNLNNPALDGGRHSPDAFASLSARSVR